MVTKKEVNDIYKKMKSFIQNGFEPKEKFDYQKFNEEIIKNLEQIF